MVFGFVFLVEIHTCLGSYWPLFYFIGLVPMCYIYLLSLRISVYNDLMMLHHSFRKKLENFTGKPVKYLI